MLFDISQASIINYILFLIFFSVSPQDDVRTIANPFNFFVAVVGPIIAKGLASIGRGIKSSSDSLILSFNMTLSASMPTI
jgi:hypothetical protein